MKRHHLGAIALSINIATTNEIQLFPAGAFCSVDGRPDDIDGGHWLMTAELAATIIASVSALKTELVIDYEHQTLRSATNGQPAPAAGWFSELEWREGEGLFAVGVKWTDNAATMIAAGEYRYISPVFQCNKKGEVKVLLHAALTNTPALDGMDDVMLAAASRLVSLSTETETTTVDDDEYLAEILTSIRWMLNLPVTATPEDIKNELQKVIDAINASQNKGTEAASADLLKLLTDSAAKIESLSANAYDPSKHVPIEMFNDVNEQLTALSQNPTGGEVDLLVATALSDGRLRPTQESWAKDLGKQNIDSLKSFLSKAPKIDALNQRQTNAMPPRKPDDIAPLAELTPEEIALCHQFGNDPAEIAKQLKD